MKDHEIKKELVIFGAPISVYEDGSIWNHRSNGRRRFGNTTDKGYKVILIREGKREHTVFVHRLVAMAFVPNSENKPQINHKNGNKSDNRPQNLEWCTNDENQFHRVHILKHIRRTPIVCVETQQSYNSILEASVATNINRANIYGCLKGVRKTAGGYRWKLKGE